MQRSFGAASLPSFWGLFVDATFQPNECLIPQDADSEAHREAFLEDLMKVPARFFRSLPAKATLAAVALGGILTLASAPAAQAYPWRDCNHRIAYTSMRYHEAVARFGPYSPAARHWAFERREAIVNCR
jgi:hypothetical protein